MTATEFVEELPAWRDGGLNSVLESVETTEAVERLRPVPQFLKPSLLYDRETQQKALYESYRRCCQRSSELILVTGVSGTGKTALVHTLRDVVGDDGGFFIEGKFDQLERVDQYYPVVGALSEFVNLVLDRPVAELQEIQERLVACRETELLLLDLIPALRLLRRDDDSDSEASSSSFRRHKPTAQAKGAGAQQRLLFAVRQFFLAVCAPHRPLVVFLDDLQWAEPASLDLIAALVNEPIPGLCLIGACRGNEVPLDHHLSVVLREMEAVSVTITQIQLGNLDQDGLTLMISGVLSLSLEMSRSLADVVMRQTSGNVFFVLQFLQSLSEEGVLCWNDDRWSWDPADKLSIDLSSSEHGRDAVGLIARKIQRLDKNVQDVLMVAACLGAEFDEYLLHEIVTFDVVQPLSVAEDMGLVTRPDANGTWRFVHDQIQQSAYSLIPEYEREQVHLQIGRKLWTSLSPDDLNLNAFLVVNQLRLGAKLVDDCDERIRLALFLLRAGELATASSAFLSAADYLHLGISLLDKRTRWRDHYELTLNLYNAAAEIEYCNGNFITMDGIIDEILLNARAKCDKGRALVASIYSLGSRNELQKAIDLGLKVLESLGERFPPRPSLVSVVFEMVKTKRMLRRFSNEKILNLHLLRAPQKQAAMRIMNLMFAYCLNGRPMFAPLIAMRLVQMTLLHGLSGMACVGFSAYAMLLCISLNDVEEGGRCARVSLAILEKFQSKEWLPRTYCAVHGFCLPLKEPLRHQLKPLLYSHRVGLGSGDIEFSMLSAVLYTGVAIHCANPTLPQVYDDMQAFVGLMKAHNQVIMAQFLLPNMQFVKNMLGESLDPARLCGDALDLEMGMREALSTRNETIAAIIQLLKLLLASYFEVFDMAERAAADLSKLNLDSFSVFTIAVQHLHGGLTSLALVAAGGRNRRMRIRAAKRSLKKLKELAAFSTYNFRNKVSLLEAEIAFVNGRLNEAVQKYDEAIASAGKELFWNEAGLACERAARALELKGSRDLAVGYLQGAISSYERWGAQAKIRAVESKLSSYRMIEPRHNLSR